MRWSALVLSLGALGCPAAQLGVELPRGGPDAISAEDLQRDTWMLADDALGGRAVGSRGARDAGRRLQERLAQMHTLPAFGQAWERAMPGGGALVCGQRDGRSGKAIVLISLDSGQGVRGGALGAAQLVSLAKAGDIPQPPEHTWVFCYGPQLGGLDAYAAQPAVPLSETLRVWVLGPLAGPVLKIGADEGALGAAPLGHISAPDVAVPDVDGMESVDYRTVGRHLQALVVSPELTGPPR